MIALDTETTGADHYHGAKPFLVTFCVPTADGESQNTHYEWAVNPLDRQPIIPQADLDAIRDDILDPDHGELILHNSRFDCAALNQIIPFSQEICWWPWDRTEDTLVAAHVLGSALQHGLDVCAVQYLGYRKMNEYEDRIEAAVKKARDYTRRCFPDWMIAEAGLPNMPSVKKSKSDKEEKNNQDKDKPWKSDMWLLKALLDCKSLPDSHRERIEGHRKDWLGESGDGLCAEYANLDSAITLRLWPVMKGELHRRGLWEIYKERMKLLPIAYRMERNGLSLSQERLEELVARYAKGVADAQEACLAIAKKMNYPLTLPKGSANNSSLKTFLFGEATVSCQHCKKRVCDSKDKTITDRRFAERHKGKSGQCRFCKRHTEAVVREWPWLDLPVLKETEGGEPALDKEVMEQYLNAEELTEDQHTVLTGIVDSRKGGKALEALEGYKTFWLPYTTEPYEFSTLTKLAKDVIESDCKWRIIHPNLNPTATNTLRWSSKNPNLQNIGKGKGFNNRYPFGPAPGREAWSFDFKNIEKRIPTYESGEEALVALFEEMDKPPFFGSDHILKFSVIYPDIWEKALKDHGAAHAAEWIKSPEGYKDTYYQWIKNTNFALQYECGDAKADKTAHAKGVKKTLSGSFPKEAAMKKHWIAFANKHGYVETMPDRTVNPNKGYPLMTMRTNQFGRMQVSPTIPLAYRVSGTAMQLTAKAMVRCQEQLDVWNRECRIHDHYRMSMQTHDELFFDWPKAKDPQKNPRRSNLARARIIQRIMEGCGETLVCKRLDGKIVDVPTPVSVEFHPVSWDKGVSL